MGGVKSFVVSSVIVLLPALLLSADSYVLETKGVEMVFRKAGRTWLIDHFGARGVSAADAASLAPVEKNVQDADGARKNATLSVFGADTFGADANRHGGLSVTHADGVVSTELEDAGSSLTEDADGSRTLTLNLKDRVADFFVKQVFRAWPDCDVFETWLEIRNGEPGDVRLVRMDSVALTFPCGAGPEPRLLTLTGDWVAEASLAQTVVPRGQTVSAGSRSGVRDAWAANPALMLSQDAGVTERAGTVIGAVLCWSGAHRESVANNPSGSIEVCLGAENVSGPYVLAPGKAIVTPKAVLTWSRRGRGQVSRNFHRWARRHRLPHGRTLRDVLLNSWEGSFFTFTEKTLVDMMDGVREMGGELFVLDDGWFGCGEFARDEKNKDTVGLGDWVVNPAKLPHGLSFLSDEAKKRGLRFGLWIEPEMTNTRSALATAHPDWLLQEPARRQRLGRGGTQTVLDFTNPAVIDNIYGQLDALFSSVPDLRYVKWDANADFFNYGCRGLPRDRQANLWFDYTVGVYGLLSRLAAKYPKLVFQACSSGGGHMDYGFLAYADEFWTSDDTDAHERVFIQWGASQFYPACAMAAHVTASPNLLTNRTTPFKFRFDVAMSGRLGFELHPKDLSADEVSFARSAVATYKEIRPTVQQGDLYRIDSPYGNDHAALMYVSEDGATASVFVYGLVRRASAEDVRIRLDGLDPKARYVVREVNRATGAKPHVLIDGKVLSGAALMDMGILTGLSSTYDSCVLTLKRVMTE